LKQLLEENAYVEDQDDKASQSGFLTKKLPFGFEFSMGKEEVTHKLDSLVEYKVFFKKEIPLDSIPREIYTITDYNYINREDTIPILMSFQNERLKMFGYYLNDISRPSILDLEEDIKNIYGAYNRGIIRPIFDSKVNLHEPWVNLKFWYKNNLRITSGFSWSTNAIIYYNYYETSMKDKQYLRYRSEEMSIIKFSPYHY